jgi:hypothetical protein
VDDVNVIGRKFKEHLLNLPKMLQRFGEVPWNSIWRSVTSCRGNYVNSGILCHLRWYLPTLRSWKLFGNCRPRRIGKLSGYMNVLQRVYFRFRQRSETAD